MKPIIKEEAMSLRDVTIIPATISNVEHRGDVNPYTFICERKSLPIFVAPMATVTDDKNYKTWIDNKVTPVIPRTIDYNIRLKLAKETFVSLSLEEAKYFANTYSFNDDDEKLYICIDVANGNMKELISICRKIKHTFKDKVELMSGNIANPVTYITYCLAKIDWVRVGIGGGSRCTTSCATGIHYPMASLLESINEAKLKANLDFNTKIIADGGINWYDDINKALALGADAVMMGKMFAECEEACGKIYEEKGCRLRNYAGMSHRSMQAITGGDGSKVSEGIVEPVKVKYPVSHFINNVEAYLRSCMSYTDSFTLSNLKEAQLIRITNENVYRK